MARSTSVEMVREVGGLIDLDVDDNTTPSTDEVIKWLNRAAIDLVKVMPEAHLSDLMHEEVFSGVTEVDSTDLTYSLLRIINVSVSYRSAVKIPEIERASLVAINPNRYSEKQPAYSVTGVSGIAKIKVYPSRASLISVLYVPIPTKYVNGGTGDLGALALPESLEELAVRLAAIRYREQDEEPGQVQLYKAQFVQDLQLYYNVESVNFDI